MKTYRSQIISEEAIQKIHLVFCNKCGNEIDYCGYKDYLDVKKHWGYWSHKDMQTDEFDLCENCYDDFVATFKHPVDKSEQW